jgi:hypothetical protein
VELDAVIHMRLVTFGSGIRQALVNNLRRPCHVWRDMQEKVLMDLFCEVNAINIQMTVILCLLVVGIVPNAFAVPNNWFAIGMMLALKNLCCLENVSLQAHRIVPRFEFQRISFFVLCLRFSLCCCS